MTALSTATTTPPTAAVVPTAPPTPEHVLIVGHGDGYFEVFADRHVRVHFQQLPTTGTPEGEIVAEKFIECTMPRPYLDIYYPSNRRLLERVTPIKPSDIARRRADVELLRGIQGAGI